MSEIAEATGSLRAYAARRADDDEPMVDLLRWPVVGRFLRWRHGRCALQLPLFLLAAVLVLHGLYGPDLAPKNLATLRHLGPLPRPPGAGAAGGRQLLLPGLPVPAAARAGPPVVPPRAGTGRGRCGTSGWPSRSFVAVLFAYELFGAVGSAALDRLADHRLLRRGAGVDALFKHASFCKWVCPIGQFNFVASTVSPLEVKVRDPAVCAGVPDQGLHPRHARRAGAGGTGRCRCRSWAARLRAGAVPAAEGGQPGLHLLPGLRPRLPARQRRPGQPHARRRAGRRHPALGRRAGSTAARTWRRWCWSSPSGRC